MLGGVFGRHRNIGVFFVKSKNAGSIFDSLLFNENRKKTSNLMKAFQTHSIFCFQTSISAADSVARSAANSNCA